MTQGVKMARVGFYPGSFDPVTLGHVDIIRRAARIVDELVIGVGVHVAKTPLFSADERIALLKEETAWVRTETGTRITIVPFDNLAVDVARAHGASMIIRGLRDGTDLDYEAQMAGMNGAMAPEIETVLLAAAPQVRHIAANLVRQIALMGGDVSPFVSPKVAEKLRARAEAVRAAQKTEAGGDAPGAALPGEG